VQKTQGAKMKNRVELTKKAKVILFGVISIILLMQPALAEKYQISLFVGMNHVFQYGSEGDYVLSENDFPVTPAHTPPNLGASFALNLKDNIALELDWRYTLSSKLMLVDPSDQDEVEIDSSKRHTITLNFIYRFLQGNVKPYIVVGGGLDKILAKDQTYTTQYGFEVDFLAPDKTIDPVANIGAGVQFFFRPNIGIRLDLRYVMIFAEPDNLSGLNGIAGISFFF
jgi:opacity protein-like surface antigen